MPLCLQQNSELSKQSSFYQPICPFTEHIKNPTVFPRKKDCFRQVHGNDNSKVTPWSLALLRWAIGNADMYPTKTEDWLCPYTVAPFSQPWWSKSVWGEEEGLNCLRGQRKARADVQRSFTPDWWEWCMHTSRSWTAASVSFPSLCLCTEPKEEKEELCWCYQMTVLTGEQMSFLLNVCQSHRNPSDSYSDLPC